MTHLVNLKMCRGSSPGCPGGCGAPEWLTLSINYILFQKVYCGHEYSIQNLTFGNHVEPENEAIRVKLDWCQSMRNANPAQPTIPSTIGKLFLLRHDLLSYLSQCGNLNMQNSNFFRESEINYKLKLYRKLISRKKIFNCRVINSYIITLHWWMIRKLIFYVKSILMNPIPNQSSW